MNHELVEFFINAITGTPTWVWVIFVYLLLIGYKATRTRVIYLPKLYIIPIILIGLQYKLFLSGNLFNIVLYLSFLSVGVGIGILSVLKTSVKILKELKSIELPGNYSTLILLFLFFCIKYIFGYLQATNAVLASEYAFLEIAIVATFTGFFLGRTLNYTYRFFK